MSAAMLPLAASIYLLKQDVERIGQRWSDVSAE
jgi:hypothetical protein